MTQLQILDDLEIIVTQVVFWVSVGFVLGVSTFWPWWKNDLGWTIIIKTACITGILVPFILHLYFGINESTLFWRWTTLVLFSMIAIVMAWRFTVLWVIQRYSPPPMKSGRAAYGKARMRWKIRRSRDLSTRPEQQDQQARTLEEDQLHPDQRH